MPLAIQIITPQKTALEADVLSVHLPTLQGEIEVLPDHADLITALSHGELSYRETTGELKTLFIGGGFLQVENNHLLLVTDMAVDAQEIGELNTVKEAIERAQKALRDGASVMDREEQAYLESQIAQQLALLDFRKSKKK